MERAGAAALRGRTGNIPGGKRDVLRTDSFNDGQFQGFAVDSGFWQVSSGQLQVGAASLGGDAAAVFSVPDYLPRYLEILASISLLKPTAGWKANAYVIFDYQSRRCWRVAAPDIALAPSLTVPSPGTLAVTPSFEAVTDGDDYVEGGGADVRAVGT